MMKNWYVVISLLVLSCVSLDNPSDGTNPNNTGGDPTRTGGLDSTITVIYYDTITYVDTVTYTDTTWYTIDTSQGGDTVITRFVTVYDTTVYIDTVKVVDGNGGKIDTVRIRDTVRVHDTVRVAAPVEPPTIKTSAPVIQHIQFLVLEEDLAHVEVVYELSGCTRFDMCVSTTTPRDPTINYPDIAGGLDLEFFSKASSNPAIRGRCIVPDTSQWSSWSIFNMTYFFERQGQ